MLRAVFFAFVAVLAAAVPAFAADNAEARYQTLLAAAQSGDGPVDWQALRYAYADRPGFILEEGREDRAAMFAASNSGDWEKALSIAVHILDKNYVDGMAHMTVATAHTKLGHPALLAQREYQAAKDIFASIKTGDGLSYEHAFTVIGVYEEYDLFITMHLDHGRQSLQQHDGHTFDVFETKDAEGKPVTYYFNIDRVWAAEMRMMRAGQK